MDNDKEKTPNPEQDESQKVEDAGKEKDTGKVNEPKPAKEPEKGNDPEKGKDPEKDKDPDKGDDPEKGTGDKGKDVHAERMEAAGNMFSGLGDLGTGIGNMATGIGNAADKMKATVSLSEASAPTKLGSEAIKTMSTTDLATIIGAPLNAAINAQYAAAKKTLECINEFGVKNGTLAVVTFNFFRNGRKAKLSIPLLTLVPINNMRINEMTYNFKLAIKTSSQVNMVNSAMASMNAYAGTNATDALAAIGGGKEAIKKDEKAVEALGQVKDGEGTEKPATGEVKKTTDQQPATQEKATTPATQKTAEKTATEKTATDKAAASADAVKNAVRVEPTFGVSFSSKKDSKATQSSKYSVETSMDVTIKVGPDDMPGGISKMLEILNDSIDVFNPNGELTVSTDKVKLSDGVAIVTAVYHDTEGNIAPEKIACTMPADKKVEVESTNNGESRQFIFTKPGLYMLTAEKLKYAVTVEAED